jgi:hypothetical protein
MPLAVRNVFPAPEPQTYRLVDLMYETASLCGLWKKKLREFKRDNSFDEALIQDFINRTVALDVCFDHSIEDIPPESKYTEEPISSLQHLRWLRLLLATPGCPKFSHRYSSYGEAVRWNFFRTTRLVLNGNLLEMLCQMPASTPSLFNLHETTSTRIQTIADEICSCILAHLAFPLNNEGDSTLDIPGLRGYSLLWPMFMVGMHIKWGGGQKLDVNGTAGWVQVALKYVHDELSILKAHAFLDTIKGPQTYWRAVEAVRIGQAGGA